MTPSLRPAAILAGALLTLALPASLALASPAPASAKAATKPTPFEP